MPCLARARDGEGEKLGLLGCGLEAYILNRQANLPHPRIFIVPATVSHHIVLEAETLIATAPPRRACAIPLRSS